MKKLKIVCFLVLITIMVLNICSINVFGAENSPIENPDYWAPSVQENEILNEKMGSILGVIQVVGVVISVIVLMILGLKYMLGSAEERAANKHDMVPYLVGAMMVFSVTTIPNLVYTITESFFIQ